MEQKDELIYALDIGTRSVIGIVGRAENEKLKVLAIEREEHGKRAMMDGQIEDIAQVARAAAAVTRRLEERVGSALTHVCVAAAGRALRTERGRFGITLPSVQTIGEELIGRLEAGAVSEAETALTGGSEEGQRLFLVGYTVCQYQLDHYPLSTLLDHNGRELEAEVVATFLPGEVVESLYAAMRQAGLEVASLTLEPIAALNAAIPQELRLLNLVLADIGAGTTDIAACRDGSVVGYTMSTVAGDEITEALMKEYLVDFRTAERLKMEMGGKNQEFAFRDILGLEHTLTLQELKQAVEPTARLLAQELARQILQVNGGAPSALFLAGGGSRLDGLREVVAECVGMAPARVAVAGGNFEMSAFSDEADLKDPELTTPLGIAVSAGLGLIGDSYRVRLNGRPAKLFRSGVLTAMDVLMMNGYGYQDLIGRTGQSLVVTLDGRRTVLRGSPAEPPLLRINGAEAQPSTVIRAGDSIEFTPARHGEAAEATVESLLGEDFVGRVLVNGAEAELDAPLHAGDAISVLPAPKPRPAPPPAETVRTELAREEHSVPKPEASAAPPLGDKSVGTGLPGSFLLNGKPLVLMPKADGNPFYLMDLLRYSGLDFEHLDKPVTLRVNGEEGYFTQVLHDGDAVIIECRDS